MPEYWLPKKRDWGHPNLGAYKAASLLFTDLTLADAVCWSRGGLAYLATPYTKISSGMDGDWCQRASLEAAVRAALWARCFAVEGITAISPIVQAVEMVHADLSDQLDPLDVSFWENWCAPLLAASAVLIVPPIPGWDASDGIWHEVRETLLSNRKVYLLRADQTFGAGS